MSLFDDQDLHKAFESWKQGDDASLGTIFSLAQAELYSRAHRQCSGENRKDALSPEELVSVLFETYLVWKKREFPTLKSFFNALEKGMKILLRQDMHKKRKKPRHVSLDELLSNDPEDE